MRWFDAGGTLISGAPAGRSGRLAGSRVALRIAASASAICRYTVMIGLGATAMDRRFWRALAIGRVRFHTGLRIWRAKRIRIRSGGVPL